MKDREARLRAIKKIIRENRVQSQESLLNLLRLEGFVVTQATLSRDMKLLKVVRMSEQTKGYYYSMPSDEEIKESERNHVQDFQRGYVSIKLSGNIAVVRTLTGHADSVGIALDSLGIPAVLGTVAGNDTVLAILREGSTEAAFLEQLRGLIPDLEE